MKIILLGAAALSLVTASAFGADLEVSPIVSTPHFWWTGCYVGGHGGGGWGQKGLTDTAGIVTGFTGVTSTNVPISGYTVGGQIGCDYQFASNWVLGIEGAAANANIGGNTTVAVPGDNATFKEATDFLTSATARVGYSWDRWLLYAKGGAAWAGDHYSAVDANATYDFEGFEMRFGWTAGAGVEWALWNDWSLKLEYDYYGFGTRSVTFIDQISTTAGPMDIKQSIQVVKLGLNFHVFAGSAAAPFKW